MLSRDRHSFGIELYRQKSRVDHVLLTNKSMSLEGGVGDESWLCSWTVGIMYAAISCINVRLCKYTIQLPDRSSVL